MYQLRCYETASRAGAQKTELLTYLGKPKKLLHACMMLLHYGEGHGQISVLTFRHG